MIGACTYAARGDLRLSRGKSSEDGNARYGRLEVFDNVSGGWGSICETEAFQFEIAAREGQEGPSFISGGTPLNDEAINVACKQLGFERGERAFLPVRIIVPALTNARMHALQRAQARSSLKDTISIRHTARYHKIWQAFFWYFWARMCETVPSYWYLFNSVEV